MKLFYFLIATAFVATYLSGEGHSSTIHLTVNPTSIKSSHLKGYHQFNGKIAEDTYFLVSGQYSPYFLKPSHHLEGGFGLRKFYDELGIGLNLGYSLNNHSGRFANQLSPGIEFFYDQFHFFGNHYLPLKFERKIGNLNITYPHVTEIGFHYQFKDKYEFGLIPYYDHSIGKMGISAQFSRYLNDEIEAVMRPHFSASNKGISISFNYHFGPKKTGKDQPLRKNSDLYHKAVKLKKEPEKLPVISLPINSIEPTQIVESPKEVMEIPVAPEVAIDEIKDIDTPAQSEALEDIGDLRWSDFFFKAIGRV